MPLLQDAVNQGANQAFQNAMPLLQDTLNQGLNQGLIEFTPRLVENLQPQLLTGITEGIIGGMHHEVIPMILEGAQSAIVQGARQAAIENAQNQVKNQIVEVGAKMILNVGVSAVAGLLGLDASQALALTNSGGGKRTKKLKRRNKSNKIIKKVYLNRKR